MTPPCPHATTEIRCRTYSNGTKHFQRQCCECGETIGNAISKYALTPEQTIAASKIPWDDIIRTRIAADERADYLALSAAEWGVKRAAYHEYLKSDAWWAKRSLVMARENNICQGCRLVRAEEVHHLTYARIFDELLIDLVAFCEPCHRKIHVFAPWDSREGNP